MCYAAVKLLSDINISIHIILNHRGLVRKAGKSGKGTTCFASEAALYYNVTMKVDKPSIQTWFLIFFGEDLGAILDILKNEKINSV